MAETVNRENLQGIRGNLMRHVAGLPSACILWALKRTAPGEGRGQVNRRDIRPTTGAGRQGD